MWTCCLEESVEDGEREDDAGEGPIAVVDEVGKRVVTHAAQIVDEQRSGEDTNVPATVANERERAILLKQMGKRRERERESHVP